MFMYEYVCVCVYVCMYVCVCIYIYIYIVLTNDGICTCEFKSRIAMAKAAFNEKKTLFSSKLDLNLRKKLVRCCVWKYGFVWC